MKDAGRLWWQLENIEDKVIKLGWKRKKIGGKDGEFMFKVGQAFTYFEIHSICIEIL